MPPQAMKPYINKHSVLGVVFVVVTLLWVGIFSALLSNSFRGERSDRLSGSQYNLSAVNDDYGFNPFAPYFVGFDQLRDLGVSADENRYVKDVVTNYTLYKLREYRVKVSYINESYKQVSASGLDYCYAFDIGVDGNNQHTVSVCSNIISEKATITVKEKNGPLQLSKQFRVFSIDSFDDEVEE